MLLTFFTLCSLCSPWLIFGRCQNLLRVLSGCGCTEVSVSPTYRSPFFRTLPGIPQKTRAALAGPLNKLIPQLTNQSIPIKLKHPSQSPLIRGELIVALKNQFPFNPNGKNSSFRAYQKLVIDLFIFTA